MSDILSLIAAELSAFLAATEKREYLIVRAEQLFDQFIAPIDLPGPDRMLDPILRASIRPVVGYLYDRLYNELAKRRETITNA